MLSLPSIFSYLLLFSKYRPWQPPYMLLLACSLPALFLVCILTASSHSYHLTCPVLPSILNLDLGALSHFWLFIHDSTMGGGSGCDAASPLLELSAASSCVPPEYVKIHPIHLTGTILTSSFS